MGDNIARVVCAIGASAGGLDALKKLLGKLPPNPKVAYIIAQHLSPDHTSHLTQILGEACDHEVVEARNGDPLLGGKIFVAPPNANIEIDTTRVLLNDPAKGAYPKPSADKLLESVAGNFQERGIGIILSGTGSDGARGIRAIRQAGGITMAQDPDEAQYDGMPSAAADTRCVDMVLKLEKMAESLTQILTRPDDLVEEATSVASRGASPLTRICNLVQKHTGTDISYYKEGTLERRVARRMAMLALSDMADYERRLKSDNEEAQALASSILISVTSFMRDPEAFDALREVMRNQISQLTPEQTLRVWVPACASGEEAYSIAILYQDIVADMSVYPSLIIFASDMDEGAVNIARAGVYGSESLGNLNSAQTDRYFRKEGNAWSVKKAVRQNVVFSIQNLVEDPPFSRIDLISCRNLLIYLKPNVQKKVFGLLHYSLRPGGYLFVGQSESAEAFSELFKQHDKSARIYRRSHHSGDYSVSFTESTIQLRLPRAEVSTPATRDRRRNTLQELAHSTLVRDMAIAWAVVDEHDVVKCLSRDARHIFTLPEGPTVLRIFSMLPDALQPEARSLLYRSRKENKRISGARCVVNKGEEKLAYRMDVIPFADDFEKLWLVVLNREEAPREPDTSNASSDAEAYIRDLEQRVTFLSQDLQSVTEELETSNEELQSQSEELQSSNEELQSMNEQLLTSNEELQSSNEELLTMNDEIRVKTEQLQYAATSLYTLINQIPHPVLFCNSRLRITAHNDAVHDVSRVGSCVPDKPLQNVEWNFTGQELIQACRKSVSDGTIMKVEIRESEQQWLIRIDPCAHEDQQMEGLMLRFEPLAGKQADS